MKIAPVSGDLLVKVALVVVGVGVAVYAMRRAASAVSALPGATWNAAIDAMQYINPASTENVAYQTVNQGVQWATGDPHATLGTWMFEFLNPGTVAAENAAIGRAPAPQPLGVYGSMDEFDPYRHAFY